MNVITRPRAWLGGALIEHVVSRRNGKFALVGGAGRTQTFHLMRAASTREDATCASRLCAAACYHAA